MFVCDVCNYSTKFRHNLLRHKSVHSGIPTHHKNNHTSCDWCMKVFTNPQNCSRHKKLFCKQRPGVQNVVHSVQNVASGVQNVVHDVQNVNPGVQNVVHEVFPVDEQTIPVQVEGSNVTNPNEYPCPTCFRVFNRPSKLDAHKPICDNLSNILECPRCHNTFYDRHSKSRHMRTCSSSNPTNLATITVVGSTNTINNNTINSNTINSNNTVNNSNVQINNYCNDNMAYIPQEFWIEKAKDIGGRGVIDCFREMKCRPDHPENHNMRLIANPGVDPFKYVAVHDGEKWVIRSSYFSFDGIFQHMRLHLRHAAKTKQKEDPENGDEYEALYKAVEKIDPKHNPNGCYEKSKQIIREVLSEQPPIWIDGLDVKMLR